MKTLHALRSAFLAFVALAGIAGSQAQSTPQVADRTFARVALRVENLTCEERDRLSRVLGERGDLRISYACVPAGIIILESVRPDLTVDSVRAKAVAALIQNLPAQRRSEVALSQLEAEELCSEARAH